MHSPKLSHWQTVKRILRHLKGTLKHGLLLKEPIKFTLQAFVDVDWALDPDDRRSTSRIFVYFYGNLVTWGSKKKHSVSISSTEAAFCCLANAAIELVWLTSLQRTKDLSTETTNIVV